MLKQLVKAAGIVAFGLALLLIGQVQAKAGQKQIRVVIIDGQNNHNWRATTPLLKKVLEENDRFSVEVSSHVRKGDKESPTQTIPFPPDLSKFDVVVSNYNGRSWPEGFNKEFEEQLQSGKIGLVIVHAANNSFGNWKEYNLMIGMGWRGSSYGKRLKLNDDGERIIVPKGEDQGSGHRYSGNFAVVVRDPKHPVTKGMSREWMHNRDELYDNMRGPIENVHLLATAYSKGTKAHEPMIWTVSYGQGRVFHTPMGHDTRAMSCVGFVTTLLRGTEWAATGEVTIPIPDNFPTAKQTSTIETK